MANYKPLTAAGVPVRLAEELATQIEAGEGNRRRLEELGMVPTAAKEVVAQLEGTSDRRKLVHYGIVPEVAKVITDLIDAQVPEEPEV